MDLNNFKPEYNLTSDTFLGNEEIYEKKLSRLIGMAKDEIWEFSNPDFNKSRYYILKNYLCFTYDRLKAENKLCYLEDGSAMCFNTGLQTKQYESDIYAYFVLNNKYPSQSTRKWFFVKFVTDTASELTKFTKLPDIADYIDNPADVIFDKKLLPIRFYHNHIVSDNIDRFKKIGFDELSIETIHNILETATKKASERVRRNYKIAIPQFYTDKETSTSKIQLLLPLCLKKQDKADLALVVEKEENAYIAKTVLPLDWAYINARRIVRPDVEWIQEF